MNRGDFAQLVREALARLYDRPFLDGHPLRALLTAEEASGSADDLQRILVEAIQQLRPSRASPQYLPRWRRYRHLCLRYLEGANPSDIAEELSISERQVRRDHQDAVDALTGILWARYSRLRWVEGSQITDQPSLVSDREALEAELRRITSTPAQTQVELGETIESALATVTRLLEERGISVELSLPDALPPALADRVVVRQILVNVFAYAANRAGCERLSVSAKDEGQSVHLRVAIHYRRCPYPDHAWNAAGSALPNPLAASRRLVELQGGIFEQHAEPSGDEEIRLSLPCVPLSTVLVIDDNPDFVRLFRRYLGDSPYRIAQAGVSAEALEMARVLQPDLITLDVMMPSQDGWEVLQALKADPQTREIPVLVCSVLHESSLALSLGANGFLAKPVTRQGLLDALERCARRTSLGAR